MANAFTDGVRNFFKPLESPEQRSDLAVPDAGIGALIPAPEWGQTGTAVTVEQALTIPAVQRSVTAITTAVSQLDLDVAPGSRAALALAAQPDSTRSAASFFGRTVTDLATTGNAYWRIFRNADGSAQTMRVLSPSRMTVKYSDTGSKYYVYRDFSGTDQTYANNLPGTNDGQVEHIKLGEYDGHVYGLGPIQLNNAALYAVLDLRYYTERFIRESKRPSGIYAVKGDADAADLANVKARIMQNQTSGEPQVLPGDVTYQSVMVTPEAMDLIEQNKAAVLEVSRMFGVPPYKLASAVDGNSMTYQNVGQADTAWVRESLDQYLTAVEDAFTNVLPRGQVATFNTDAWLRAAEAIEIQTKETAPAAA